MPVWPDRIQELARQLRALPPGDEQQAVLGRLWIVLGSSLDLAARRARAQAGRIDDADLEDLVSQKSLDLVRRLDRGLWRPEDDEPRQVAAYIKATARNAIADVLRRESRLVHVDPTAWGSDGNAPEPVVSIAEDTPDRAAFVEQLRVCVSRLRPRARTVWFLRVFYELPSRSIARHPEVGMTIQNVDVTLHRTRTQVTECMASAGFEATSVPTGAFEAMWNTFRPPTPEEQP